MSPGAGADGASVVLVVEFTARPDTVDELRERLLRLVVLTRAEDGCLRYDLHSHPDDPLRLTFVEEWASPAAHARHDETDWVRDIREHLPRLVAGAADGAAEGGVRVTRLARLEP
jgi:quinol monooxygenase YgiN